MAQQELIITIDDIKSIKEDIFLFSFRSAFLSKTAKPGMFIHIKIPGTILRRPLSIHDVIGAKIYILFRVKGRGTKILSSYKPQDKLNIIGPLGKGFDLIDKNNSQHILIAGGLGVAPLRFLAHKLSKNNKTKENIIILGAKTGADILVKDEFQALGYQVYITTQDGSLGHKGVVTQVLDKILSARKRNYYSYIYACGPEIMFKAINDVIIKYSRISCQVSFEQFMGCGLGICCGCTIATNQGYKKVCKDGPVFDIKNIYNKADKIK